MCNKGCSCQNCYNIEENNEERTNLITNLLAKDTNAFKPKVFCVLIKYKVEAIDSEAKQH